MILCGSVSLWRSLRVSQPLKRLLPRAGKTIDSALRRIARAIELHVRGLREDGLHVPRPNHRTVTPRRKAREIDFYATVEIAA